VGSAINEDPQDAQSLMFPITMPLILAIIIMINAIPPESGLATWSSIIPFFSPIVMMAATLWACPDRALVAVGAQYDHWLVVRVPVYHLRSAPKFTARPSCVWQKDYLEGDVEMGHRSSLEPHGACGTCFLLRFFTTEDTRFFHRGHKAFAWILRGHKGASRRVLRSKYLCVP